MSVEIDGVNKIIKTDTISEATSANGVAVDSLAIKDGKITNLMNATLSAADLGSGIHIKAADSGASVEGLAGQLVVEGDGHSGMSILSGTSHTGNINFGDSGDANIGFIQYNHASNALGIGTNASTRISIDDSGRVGIGTTSPSSYNSSAVDLVVANTGHSGITIASGTSSSGNIFFADGTSGVTQYRGTIQYNHTNDFMVFGTTGGTERFRISDAGLHIGGTGSANALDDYEEGTWTAAIKDQSNNAVTMGDAAGSYTKVGRLVFIQGYFRVNGLGSASGNVRLTGLPFAIANNNNAYASASVGYAANLNNAAVSVMTGYTAINTSDIFLQNWDATHSTSHLQASELSLDGEFILSCTYRTA